MGPIIKDIEQGGPQAMMKYWNDPETLKKINEAMADVMPGMGGMMPPGFGGGGGHADVAEQMKNLNVDNEEEEEEEEDEEDSVLTAASAGDVELLKQLIEEKEDVNKSDGEG